VLFVAQLKVIGMSYDTRLQQWIADVSVV